MKVLAIDTTGEEKSFALACGGQLLAEFSFNGDLFLEFWPHLKCFLNANRVKIKEVDCFAVNTGPGSWTGLRFGISVVKGLAAATGRKVFGLPAAELSALAPSEHTPYRRLLPSAGHTPAAFLACRCSGGVNPEDLKLVYGRLPKFRKLQSVTLSNNERSRIKG
ncbi:MAG: tRNA threonylcarbamoyladenosine biosynthesis protein TsaB [Candidatus Omnitrophota bacterium]